MKKAILVVSVLILANSALANPRQVTWEVDNTLITGIDLTGYSYPLSPAFADLDNDNDYDLIIGAGDGYLHGFRNTGTSTVPSWIYDPALVAGLGDQGNRIFIALGDLDGDADYDMLIANNFYTSFHRIFAYRNTGTVTNPVWTWAPSLIQGADSIPGTWDGVALCDLDGDGDLDLLSSDNGYGQGKVVPYRNTGSTTVPAWTLDSTLITGIEAYGQEARIGLAFGDLDGDLDNDLFMFARIPESNPWNARMFGYRNIGSTSTPLWAKDYNLVTGLPTSSNTARNHSLADLDADGDLDLVLTKNSGIKIEGYRNTTPPDITPPRATVDLSISAVFNTSVMLTWTAPGDDSITGTASVYDIRYSTSPITDSTTWVNADTCTGEPSPNTTGSTEYYEVTGLAQSTHYYFALKTADEVPNWSGLSNCVDTTTLSSTDNTPPAPVTDLSVSTTSAYWVTLAWTAPGDDSITGTASIYDIRYSTSPITDSTTWANASQCTGEPIPQIAGSTDSFTVSGLSSNTPYHFALKTGDEVPNWSGLSNCPNMTTLDLVQRTIGYDDGRDEGLSSGTTRWFFVSYPGYLDLPYTVKGVWIYGGGKMNHIGVFPDNGSNLPDTLNPYLVIDDVSLSPPSWKKIFLDAVIPDSENIWIGINPGYTTYNGYVGEDHNSAGMSWLLESGSFYFRPFNYMIQLIVEGGKSGHDVTVLPSWTNPRYRDRNPSAGIAPANCYVKPRVPVQNTGSTSETFNITCSIDSLGTNVYTSTQLVSNLAPDAVTYVEFYPAWRVAGTGNMYNVSIYAQLAEDCCLSNDTLSLNLTADSTEELCYDDFILNAYSVFLFGSEYIAKRMTPSTYPAQFMQLRYYIRVGDSVDFYIWDDANPSNRDVYEPGNPVWSTTEYVTGGSGHWHTIDVSGESLIITESEVEWYSGLYAEGLSVYFWKDYQEGFHYGNRMPSFADNDNYFFRATLYYPEQLIGCAEYKAETMMHPSLEIHPTIARQILNINYYTGQNPEDAELKIYDATGRLIRSFPIINLCNPNRSVVSVYWNGIDDLGSKVPAGIYFIRLETPDHTITKKAILLR